MKLLKVLVPVAAIVILAAFTLPKEESINPNEITVDQTAKTGLEIGDIAPDLEFENPVLEVIPTAHGKNVNIHDENR